MLTHSTSARYLHTLYLYIEETPTGAHYEQRHPQECSTEPYGIRVTDTGDAMVVSAEDLVTKRIVI